MIQDFAIRAEYANGTFEDFSLSAVNLDRAKVAAEHRIEMITGDLHQFDWRGQVVFVDHSPRVYHGRA